MGLRPRGNGKSRSKGLHLLHVRIESRLWIILAPIVWLMIHGSGILNLTLNLQRCLPLGFLCIASSLSRVGGFDFRVYPQTLNPQAPKAKISQIPDGTLQQEALEYTSRSPRPQTLILQFPHPSPDPAEPKPQKPTNPRLTLNPKPQTLNPKP